ncbi:MAG: hypothetical protein ABI877_15955 [Gemmatimonadaceae bacterium]
MHQRLFRYGIFLGALLISACVDNTVTGVSAVDPTQISSSFAVLPGAQVVINFENPPYTVGTIDGQDDWTSQGAAGSGCAVYDHAVAANTYGYGFGLQTLRMSNAVTSGCFDGTYSKRLTNAAGEPGSLDGTFSLGGPRQSHFEAQWDFGSTVPGAEQPGLSVVASPDRGDGSRMSWIQTVDTTAGVDINFFDVQGTSDPANFVFTHIITVPRGVAHTIKVTMDFVPGPSNDVVKVYVDGVLKHTGTSWENYYRFDTQDVVYPGVPITNRILYRTGGTAAPATAGNGFVIDALSLLSSSPVGPPTNANQCKNGGWKTFNTPRTFRNQADCILFVWRHRHGG